MSEDRHMEVHYMDSGFPYTAPSSFMDFFGGLSQAPLTYANPPPMHHNQAIFFSPFTFNLVISYIFHLHGKQLSKPECC